MSQPSTTTADEAAAGAGQPDAPGLALTAIELIALLSTGAGPRERALLAALRLGDPIEGDELLRTVTEHATAGLLARGLAGVAADGSVELDPRLAALRGAAAAGERWIRLEETLPAEGEDVPEAHVILVGDELAFDVAELPFGARGIALVARGPEIELAEGLEAIAERLLGRLGAQGIVRLAVAQEGEEDLDDDGVLDTDVLELERRGEGFLARSAAVPGDGVEMVEEECDLEGAMELVAELVELGLGQDDDEDFEDDGFEHDDEAREGREEETR